MVSQSLFQMLKPYTIISPPWETTSGGIRVMYGLYGWLLAKGQIVHLNVGYDIPSVAIYPEITHGNPANATTVVRYILNKPGVMASLGVAGPTTFDENDIIYVFSEMFNTFNVGIEHRLFLPILDLHTFKDQKRSRNKKAVFVGKGVDRRIHPEGCLLIDRGYAQDQQALADLLNECEVMYSYDPVSAMTEIARLCGCKVILLQDIYTKDDYRKYEPGLNGLSFSLEEDIPLDSKGFRDHYIDLRQQFSRKLDKFIEETQSDEKKDY